MRNSFVYLQYFRLFFADLLLWKSRKVLQKENTLYEIIFADLLKYLPQKKKKYKDKLFGFNYLMISNKIFRNVFYFRIETDKKLQSSLLKAFSKIILPPLDCIEVGVNGNGYIGMGLRIVHTQGSTIAVSSAGNNLTVHQGVTIGYSNHIGERGITSPIIGDNCTVFANAVVAGGINIGDNVIIGAGSIVLKDVPDNCTVIGNPARIIKKDGKKVNIPL